LNGVGRDFQRALAGILEVEIEGFETAGWYFAKAVLAGLAIEFLRCGWYGCQAHQGNRKQTHVHAPGLGEGVHGAILAKQHLIVQNQ
jgi:hypothetical protein